jgi:hypothetical protein
MSYINQIIQLLSINEFINVSENVEIAKGKYKLHTGIRANYKQAMRELYIKRNVRNGRKTDN